MIAVVEVEIYLSVCLHMHAWQHVLCLLRAARIPLFIVSHTETIYICIGWMVA
jgi:hypothetical protein